MNQMSQSTVQFLAGYFMFWQRSNENISNQLKFSLAVPQGESLMRYKVSWPVCSSLRGLQDMMAGGLCRLSGRV